MHEYITSHFKKFSHMYLATMCNNAGYFHFNSDRVVASHQTGSETIRNSRYYLRHQSRRSRRLHHHYSLLHQHPLPSFQSL